jgi:hypothetical protein
MEDSEAMPQHDCADCGLAIPVRPARPADFVGEVERIYFPTCPNCGGRSGWYAYLSNAMSRRKGARE